MTGVSAVTAAFTAPTERDTAAAPGRVLAIRKAAAAFGGPYDLRSASVERLFLTWACVRAQFTSVQDDLVAALYDAVPTCTSKAERRYLLAVKRRAFNADSLPPRGGDVETDRCAELIGRYEQLHRQEEVLFSTGWDDLRAEYRDRIAHLLGDDEFRLACSYASPDLAEALATWSPDKQFDSLSSEQRGINAYAARFISKANPFFTFAEIIIPERVTGETDGASEATSGTAARFAEVVIDLALVQALERRALATAASEHAWLSLRPCSLDARRCRVWVPTDAGLRIVSLPLSESVKAVLEFFDHQRRHCNRPTASRASCIESLRARNPGAEHQVLERFVNDLAAHGVLKAYLVTDPDEFGARLLAASPERDEAAERAAFYHRRRLSPAELSAAHGELLRIARIVDSDDPRSSPPYFVNSYRREDTTRFDDATGATRIDLAEIEPYFRVTSNFANNEHVMRSFVRDALIERRNESAPFLDVLEILVHNRDAIFSWYAASGAQVSPGRVAVRDWWDEMRALSGHLRRGDLARYRPPPRQLEVRSPTCFNGTLDASDGRFYITNVFADGERLLSRFLARSRDADTMVHGRGPRDESGGAPESGPLDVELAVPAPRNLNYIRPRFRTGCGLDDRQSHRYSAWIRAQEIEFVGGADGQVQYRHAPSGRILAIHYRGFMLAQYLPLEYRLLLIGHCDSLANPFRDPNPFERTPIVGRRGSVDLREEITYEAELNYESICVRRERWLVRRDTLIAAMDGDNALRSAANLWSWCHRLLKATDDWYYSVAKAGSSESSKPRFLDLYNPLSALTLRRELLSAPEHAYAVLSPMKPRREDLFRWGSAGFTSEIMLEV